MTGETVTREVYGRKTESDPARWRDPVIYVPGYASPPLFGSYVRSRLAVEGFDVYHLQAPRLQTGDVAESASILSGEIDRVTGLNGGDRVFVVAHSLGGLIARYYMKEMNGVDRVNRAVFLSVPHKGTYLGALVPFTRASRQMCPGSELLERLNQSGCGCDEVKCLSVVGRRDGLIKPRESAVLDCAHNRLAGWPPGHWGMCLSPRVIGWITDFFDGAFHIRRGPKKPPAEVVPLPGRRGWVPKGFKPV